jgi:hypothetical protein
VVPHYDGFSHRTFSRRFNAIDTRLQTPCDNQYPTIYSVTNGGPAARGEVQGAAAPLKIISEEHWIR